MNIWPNRYEYVAAIRNRSNPAGQPNPVGRQKRRARNRAARKARRRNR